MRRGAELLEQVLSAHAELTERPQPLPGDLRPSWRLSTFALLLDRWGVIGLFPQAVSGVRCGLDGIRERRR